MQVRRILTGIVGVVQSIIGVLSVIFACIAYFDFFGLRNWLNANLETLPFYLTVILVFGVFSIISGLFLIQESLELRFGGA